MNVFIVAALLFLAATAPAETPKGQPTDAAAPRVETRAKPLLPQVWVDAKANVFHSPGCKKIDRFMTSRARQIAQAQGITPAPECAVSDAEAKKRWLAELKKGNPPGSKPAGGFAVGTAPVRALPPVVDNSGGSRQRSSEWATPRSSSGSQPTVSRTEIMKASDFYDAERVIKERCTAQWRADPEMQVYCMEKQRAAVSALKQGRPFGADENAWGLARVRCAQRYPTDYDMRLYCEGNR